MSLDTELPALTLPDLLAEFDGTFPPGTINDDAFRAWGTYRELAAQGHVDARNLVRALSVQLYPSTATGYWLDEHASSVNLTRIDARPTEGTVLMTATQAVEVPAGTVVQTDVDADGRTLRFVVPEDTTVLAPAGKVPVRAEVPGVSHNVGVNRITTLVTLIPGVTGVSNTADWITTSGVDRETDDLLRQRVLDSYPAQGEGVVWRAYRLWARGVPGIVKVSVLDEHPRGQGTLDVIVAPAVGLPSADDLAAVTAAIESHRTVNDDVLVRGPTEVPVDVALVIYADGGAISTASAQARVQAVLDGLSIGDTLYPSNITDAFKGVPGVHGVQLVTPLAPIAVDADALIIPDLITVEFA